MSDDRKILFDAMAHAPNALPKQLAALAVKEIRLALDSGSILARDLELAAEILATAPCTESAAVTT